MEALFTSEVLSEETTESLLLTVDNLGIKEGVTIGMTVSAVALIISIMIVNLISIFRRS